MMRIFVIKDFVCQEAERSQPVIDGYHNHLALNCQHAPIGPLPRSNYKGATMNPDHDRQKPARRIGTVYVEVKAIFGIIVGKYRDRLRASGTKQTCIQRCCPRRVRRGRLPAQFPRGRRGIGDTEKFAMILSERAADRSLIRHHQRSIVRRMMSGLCKSTSPGCSRKDHSNGDREDHRMYFGYGHLFPSRYWPDTPLLTSCEF